MIDAGGPPVSDPGNNNPPRRPKDSTTVKNPRTKGYPRKRKPIPDDQVARDKVLGRKLYSLVYAFPFLVLIVVLLFVWFKD